MFRQAGIESLTAEKLPDGSTAIVDGRSKSVHSLNPSATVVWEACAQGATLTQIAAALEAKFGGPVDAEIVGQAIAELQRVNLIESESPLPVETADLGRRSLLKRAAAAGAIAIPVVLTLSAAEQRAYAQGSISTSTTNQPV